MQCIHTIYRVYRYTAGTGHGPWIARPIGQPPSGFLNWGIIPPWCSLAREPSERVSERGGRGGGGKTVFVKHTYEHGSRPRSGGWGYVGEDGTSFELRVVGGVGAWVYVPRGGSIVRGRGRAVLVRTGIFSGRVRIYSVTLSHSKLREYFCEDRMMAGRLASWRVGG